MFTFIGVIENSACIRMYVYATVFTYEHVETSARLQVNCFFFMFGVVGPSCENMMVWDSGGHYVAASEVWQPARCRPPVLAT